jgi:hypothetical protein
MAWDFYDPIMDGYEGVGWYALALPPHRVVPGAWQRLRFNRVNHRATVWIDGLSGGIVWCWADYRHRNGFVNGFQTFSWPFGIVTFDRHPKKARAALQGLWSHDGSSP